MDHHTANKVQDRKPINVFAMMVNSKSPPRIIVSNAPPVAGTELAFRTSNYLKIGMRASSTMGDYLVCLDTGCGMTYFEKKFLMAQYPDALI